MTQPKILALLGGFLAAVTPSAAYYHYVHYVSSSSPYSVTFEKYDLTALPDKTVTFFVSSSGPTNYTPNDSFPSLLEQFRNATQAWNSVASSDLRVAFGGLQIANTTQSVPTGAVIFDPDMPPGVLAFAGHTVSTSGYATAADGTQFVPILASTITLNGNLTQQAGAVSTEGYAGPSYSELFFTVLVHEIGHAIGLQHTYTSATMSTAVSRATNRALPLDADDIAGVSLLYPAGRFPAGFGSITGTVTMGGQGVHLASVVALLPNGSAISNLTNPDGSYEIDGVPPGNYWVYVHPLPPTANVWLPEDVNGNPVPASGPFVSTFYDGTWNPAQFATVAVSAGAPTGPVNFDVQPRSAVEVYDVTAYSYNTIGQSYVQPAYLNANAAVQTIVAVGNGIATSDTTTNVQTVQALGAPGGPLQAYYMAVYGSPNTSLAIYLDYPSPPASGPEHLLFTLPDDIYVLPHGVQIVQNPPPMVSALAPNSDGTVTVTGTGIGPGSQVFFDSLPGQITVPYAVSSQSNGTTQSGSVSVLPPPGANGQVATITVYNGDGQNSMFQQSHAPPTYSYPQTSAPAAAISLGALPQGVSAMVSVTTSTMQFLDGLTNLGFGSGDVAVRRVWVLGPSRAIANVTVSPSALQQSTMASVISGFQVYQQPLGFQVLPANPNLPIIGLPVPNAYYPVQNSLYPGAIASIYGLNLTAETGQPTLTVAGLSAQILYASASQINFVIPAGVPTGPAVLALNNGVMSAYPVVLQIDPPPPVITVAIDAGLVLGANTAAAPGDTIILVVTGMDPGVLSAPSRVAVTEGGVNIQEFTIQAAPNGSDALDIQFVLSSSASGPQVPVVVSLDGDLSMPLYIDVAVPASTSQP
ncbi:MAG: matrixin family metalloprotease [Bryobacteraceae bacterium]|jgi:uncharacterized protein (TIGR03437 family)